MKKLSLIALILLFVSSAFAKDFSDKVPKHKTKYSIGITYSPDIYIYNFKKYSDFSFSYNTEYNYSLGITGVYYPVKFLSLRVAALYSTKGFSLDYNYNTSSPSLELDSIPSASSLKADYLDLPIILHLNIIHKDRVQLFLAAGVVPGILIKKAEQTLFKSNVERETENISKHFNDVIAGTVYSIGFKYNFSAKLGIGFDPYIRYYLSKIEKESMQGNPVSFGGKFSLYFNILHKHHRGNWGK